MKVLVTGGAGFIGSYTVDLLLEKGFDVKILDNFEPQVHHNKKPEHLNDSAEFISGDIKDKNLWRKALSDADAVIHLAAMVGIGQSMYQPVRYLLTNSIGTANMFEVILENKEIKKQIQKVIVASSKSIYGEGAYNCEAHGVVYPNPRSEKQLLEKDWEIHCQYCNEYVKPCGITEEKPAQNLSIYALSKYDAERIAINFGNAIGLSVTAFRYFNVYGPRQSLNNPYTGVAAIFLSRIKNNNPPVIFEDGNQLRDFVYIEDIANANLLALEKFDGTDVFNIGTGEPISILEIAKLLIGLTNSETEPTINQKFRAGDNRHDFTDITKAKKDLGFKPKWKTNDGFKKLVEWSETQEATDKYNEAQEEWDKYFDNKTFK